MRLAFSILSLVFAGVTLWVDFEKPSSASLVCQLGLCRFDQMFRSIDIEGMNESNLRDLITVDPSNPLVWATYGDILAARGDNKDAIIAFDRAIQLGSGIAAVLMRVANFDFTHDRQDQAVVLCRQILSRTNLFDQILFSYLTQPSRPTTKLIATAIPADTRAVKSWIDWLNLNGTEQEILATWSWMKANHVTSRDLAVQVTRALWRRSAYMQAQGVWADWQAGQSPDYGRSEFLSNNRFNEDPSGSPLDWELNPVRGLELGRRDGLDLHFLGTENLQATGISQVTPVRPGRYRFSAEVSSQALTTDETPFFQVLDLEDPRRLSVATTRIPTSVSPTPLVLDFTVSPPTRIVRIALVRHASEHFDNMIRGNLHIYATSLVDLDSSAGKPIRAGLP